MHTIRNPREESTPKADFSSNGDQLDHAKRRARFGDSVGSALSVEALLAGCLNAKALQDTVVPSKPVYLGEFLKEGDLGFIHSWRGDGKTWLGLDIAKGLSQGQPVGPWKSFVKVPVVYVDGEMPAEDMKIRMYLLGITSENFTLLNHELLAVRAKTTCDINLVKPAIQQAITALCVFQKAKVLMLDNLSTLSSGLKENDNDEWDKIKGWLLHLRRLGITVIILDHQGKNYEHRGASRKEDNVTWVIKLTNLRKKGDGFVGAKFRSDFEKNRNDPAGYQSIDWSYSFDKQTHLLTCSVQVSDDDTDLKSKGGRPVKFNDEFMLKPLRNICPNKLSKDRWWQKLGGEDVIIRNTFNNRLKTLLEAGRISQDGGSFAYVETLREKAARMAKAK